MMIMVYASKTPYMLSWATKAKNTLGTGVVIPILSILGT